MAEQQPRILFSEAHGERLGVEGGEADLPCTQWVNALRDRGFAVDHSEAVVTERDLEGCDVLVIGSPTEALSHREINAIAGFADRGGGLLLISDAQAVRRPGQNLGELGKEVLCGFREYLNAFPMTVEAFEPHFVTAGLVSLTVSANCRLVTSSEETRVLAVIQETGEGFALCGEVGGGRVVAVGDSAPFADEHWEMASNSLFALQCCTWLARRNPIDLLDVTVGSQLQLGGEGSLVLNLANPRSRALRQAKCTLEANTDTAVTEGSQEIHVLPPNQRVQLRWRLQPGALGLQQLRLSVETATNTGGRNTIWFDRIAEFMCIAPVSLKLELADEHRQSKTSFATGNHFRVCCSTEWLADGVRTDLPLELIVPDEMEIVQKEAFDDTVCWYLQGNTPGYYDVAVTLPATGQQWAAGVGIRPSLDWQLENIQKEYVEPLDAEIVRRLVRVDSSFGDESVALIPFRILSPEEYIETVYPSSTINGHFGDVLRSARCETQFNLRLLNEILLNIAPIYSPRYGACAPFDPAFASKWARLHPAEREPALQLPPA